MKISNSVLLLIRLQISFETRQNVDFLSKNSTLISQENCRFFWGEKFVKMLWFFDLLALDNFDFTRKIVKKNLGENS